MISRVAAVQKKLRELDVLAMLVSNLSDIRYLSGFSGSTAYMIVDIEKATLFTDGRYAEQVKQEVDSDIEISIVSNYDDIFLKDCSNYRRFLLQSSCKIEISSKIASNNIDIYMDDNDIIQALRSIKDDNEIFSIREQYRLAAKAFLKSLESFNFNDMEREWAAILEYNMKLNGAICPSFETIVASGERSALPHGVASSKRIQEFETITIDFGSKLGYTSDYTRVVYNGEDNEILTVAKTVKDALEKAIDSIKIGMKCADIDKVARDYIKDQGYGEYFNHSLGHGVGIDVHELPFISARSDMIVEKGMVFTIEPGIYIPNKFGIRFEDTVYIDSNGKPDVLSAYLDQYIYTI